MNAELPPIGTEVPVMTRTPDAVDLFMFSAAAWLLHRIHYDLPFTTQHDGHPGLLIHGPLQGVYLVQCVEQWLDRPRLRSLNYRHLAPAYLGESLDCGGTVVEIDRDQGWFEVDLWARKDDGTVTTSGRGRFEL
jgi:hydroxyacyl-ACP dehydratase HTD2-like protein with hotdog domain